MTETFTGWGRWPKSDGYSVVAGNLEEVIDAVASVDSRGLIARGAGRSYADSATNEQGQILTLTNKTVTLPWKQKGIILASGGATLRQIQSLAHSNGYTLPVVPGTIDISVGGAVANDVHGKNHMRHGSFANYVQEIKLLDGTGKQHTVSKELHPDIFYATIGGIGLTGIIVEVTCQLRPMASGLATLITRTNNLDETLDALQNDDYEYGVAWTDINNRGRGIVTRGNPTYDTKKGGKRRNDGQTRRQLPAWCPEKLLNTATIKMLNEAQWRSSSDKEEQTSDIEKFLHPLDRITNWNIVCGRHGFIQYQFCVPNGQEDTIARIMSIVDSANLTPFLSTIKRFGAASGGMLSFPSPGWTLAFDIVLPGGDKQMTHLQQTLKQCDQTVIEAGGRVYLAKDAFLDEETFKAMYPRHEEFRKIRQKLDPNQHLQSDLGRRIGLVNIEQRQG